MKYQVVITALFMALWLAGCGQKGDLYKTTDSPPPTMDQSQSKKAAE